ncbi:MAG: hypothetical protein ABI721_00495 [Candidatus Dojkabacteria bacterium]
MNQSNSLENNPLLKLIQDKFLKLGVNFTDPQRLEVILNSFPSTMEQLKYNIQRFSYLLQSIGYDKESAMTTAQNICLKPLLYSLIPRILSSRDPNDILEKLGSTNDVGYLEQIFISVLPEMVVYLFDETTDKFTDYTEPQNNMVTNLIGLADGELIDKPYFYFHLLQNSVDEFGMKKNPDDSSNVFYKLLFPYFEWITGLGINLRTMVQLISDVITNEHRAQLLFSNPGIQTVKTYKDFFSVIEMESVGNAGFATITESEQANAIITNQGLLLVVMNSLIFNNSTAALNFEEHFVKSPLIKRFISILMALVRLADDFADMQIDHDNNVINVFLASEEVREFFITKSGILDDPLINFIMMNRSEVEDFSLITQRNFIDDLVTLYNTLMQSNSQKLNSDLIEAVKGVILAALVNAEFNDKVIAKFTAMFF